MNRKEFLKWIDPSRDMEDIYARWYGEKLRGTARDINQATLYLLSAVPMGLLERVPRGGAVGGLTGLVATGTARGAILGAAIGAATDWFQYGVRAMTKLGKEYS